MSKILKRILLAGIFLFSLAILSWFLISAPVLTSFDNNYQPYADKDQLLAHVKKLSDELPDRSIDTEKLNLSAEYIHSEFSKHLKNVFFQEYNVDGLIYKNVIAEIGETSCNGIYVIGAHYDAFNGLPGADDNASGIAGVLELARILSNKPPRCKTQLIAYTLEEPPYFRSEGMGSYIHAKSLIDKNESVALMLSIEMIGYFSDEENSQEYPLESLSKIYPSAGNFIGLVSNLSNVLITRKIKKYMTAATPLPVQSINAPADIPGIDLSDHRNYWHFGFPAIMITDTSFYRNERYHTEDDTWDTLDYGKMAMVVDGVYEAITHHMDTIQ